MSQIERGRILLATRKDVAAIYKPDREEIQQALAMLLPAYAKMTIDDVHSAPERFAALLENAKRNIIKPGYYSLPFLATYAVEQLLCEPAEDDSMNSFGQGDLDIYAFQADIAFGAFSVIRLILAAEVQGKKNAEQKIAQAVSETAVTNAIGYGEQADLYLGLRQMVQQHAAFFHEDGTGFKLVDRYVTELEQKGSPEYIGYSVPDYFIAGAELGGRLYKAFYELAERLPGSNPTIP